MKSLNILLSISFLSTLLLSPAYAEDLSAFGGEHGMMYGCTKTKQSQHTYLMNAEKLKLTDKQIKKLRDVRGECKKECVLNKAKLRVAKVDLNEALESEDIDMDLVEKKASEISELMKKLLVRSIKVNVEASMVLTEEQKEIAKTIGQK
ncbi:MAG: Spy/CpxP family protein refolding chaperone [Proteobacteria bacterium]|nr:Spy/CpxP family protein refolding chaperone [Pseudomonadota bacterium]